MSTSKHQKKRKLHDAKCLLRLQDALSSTNPLPLTFHYLKLGKFRFTVTCHRLITLCTQRVNFGCRKPDEIKTLHALIAEHAESYFRTTFQAEAPIAKRDEMRPWSFRFHRLRCDIRQQRQQSIRMQHFEEPRLPVLGYGINMDESSELCAQI